MKPFCKGIAAVRNGEAWGFIDTSGNWVLPPQFAVAGLTDENTYQAGDQSGRLFNIVRTAGSAGWQAEPYQSPAIVVETGKGVRRLMQDGPLVGMADEQGAVLLPAVYEAVQYLGHDVFTARLPGKGDCLFNADGKILTEYYQEITPAIHHGRIRFRESDRYGLLAPDGRILLPPTFWRLEIVGRHIACSKGGALHLCTDQLERLSDWPFDEVIYLDDRHWLAKTRDTGDGVIYNETGQVIKKAVVISDGRMVLGRFPAKYADTEKWGYMDSRGEVVIPFTYSYAESFWPNGKAVVWKADENGGHKKGLIDTTGQLVLEADLNDIVWHPEGVYTLIKVGKTQLLDENLTPLSSKTSKPMEYLGYGVYALYSTTEALKYRKSNWYTGEKGGLQISREAKVSGIYTLDGALLVDEPGDNEQVPQVREGFVAAKKRGKWGFVRCGY